METIPYILLDNVTFNGQGAPAPVPLPGVAVGGMALFGLLGGKRLLRRRADHAAGE